MMTSSVSLRWNASERNSWPSTGTSPSHGNLSMFCVTLFCSRPAMAKVWPLARSTVVSARRVVSDGTLMLSMTMAPSVDSSLTSGLTWRLMRSSADDRADEIEADAELLPVDADEAVAGRHRDRELAAGEEARRLARDRGEIGLGQHGDEAVIVERIDQRVEVEALRLDAAEQVVVGRRRRAGSARRG